MTDAGQRSRPWDPAWRATLCGACAAPFEVPLAGGRVICPACGVAEELPARDLRPVRFEPRADGTPRRERLREQDGKPLLPPPEIASLSDGGVLPEWKAAEALAAWQGLRRELRANPADAGAGDRLAFLSLLMQNREAGVHDPRRKRARLESALEAVALPRHRQLFLARLSRAACRAEDFASAEAWLALCDPRADDLFADSEWRLARAYLDAARRDWAAALRTLGATCDELPVHDACDNFAGVLRAHALEQLGRRDEATTELARRLVHLQDRRVVARLVDELGWCRELHSVALARVERAAAADSASRSGNLEALVLAGTAGLLFVILAIWAAVHLLDHHGVLDLLDEPPGDPGTGAVLTTGLPFVPLIMVLGLLIAAWRSYRQGRQAHRLRLAGRLMEAEVLGTQDTGTTVGGVAERDVRLRVRPPDGPPYETTTRLLLGGEHEEPLAVGATVFVRVDPAQPGRVLIVTNP